MKMVSNKSVKNSVLSNTSHRSRHASFSSGELIDEKMDIRTVYNPFSIDRILAPGARQKLLLEASSPVATAGATRFSNLSSKISSASSTAVGDHRASDSDEQDDDEDARSNGDLIEEEQNNKPVGSDVDECDNKRHGQLGLGVPGAAAGQLSANSQSAVAAAALLCSAQIPALTPFQSLLHGFFQPAVASAMTGYPVASAAGSSDLLGEFIPCLESRKSRLTST
jgi:hypothetical protein